MLKHLTSHHLYFISNHGCHTWLISLKSWLTNSKPPSKSSIASARESIVSMSKWLVGSSRRRKWGAWKASHAKTTRHLWPSDKLRIGQIYKRKPISMPVALYSILVLPSIYFQTKFKPTSTVRSVDFKCVFFSFWVYVWFKKKNSKGKEDVVHFDSVKIVW